MNAMMKDHICKMQLDISQRIHETQSEKLNSLMNDECNGGYSWNKISPRLYIL